MMNDIKLLLVDDHILVRSGLRMLLESQEDIEILAEAESGAEAVEKVKALQPDIVLMDVMMPEMNGIEATRKIKETAPETAVLALTMYEDDQYFFEMLKAGASGYVPKRAAPDELITAIRTVRRGDVFLYPSLATRLVQDYVKEEEREQIPELTAREQQVLVLVAEELNNNDIGGRLEISAKTVARHRENIMHKLNLHSRTALVKYAIQKGLIDLD
ncbi:MAG: response regulator [Anaerolineae bacterium]